MGNESNRERFVRLAEARVEKVIKGIRLIGNLSNRSNYTYNDKDVDKIFAALKKELDLARTRFDAASRGGGFKL